MSSCCFLSQNGEIISTSIPKNDFLLQHPKGAFTTTRTIGTKSVFQFTKHIDRLVESVRLLLEAENKTEVTSTREVASDYKQKYADILSADRLREMFLKDMRMVYQEAKNKLSLDQDIEITLLVSWDKAAQQSDLAANMEKLTVSDKPSGQKERDYDVFVHFRTLPDISKKQVTVKLAHGCRENAKAESSEWCRVRKEYEAKMPKGAEEVVLMDENGNILEGVSSNFYIIQDGKVYSAVEGVLPGTVQALLFEVCQQANIPVEKKAPNFNDCREWGGAMVSSACRLVLPVHHIQLVGKDERTIDFEYSKESIALKIENLVARAAERYSESVFE